MFAFPLFKLRLALLIMFLLLLNLTHVGVNKICLKRNMFLILKARRISNPLGAKLMKLSKDSSIHRAKDDYISSSTFLPDTCQKFTGVHQKSRC